MKFLFVFNNIIMNHDSALFIILLYTVVAIKCKDFQSNLLISPLNIFAYSILSWYRPHHSQGYYKLRETVYRLTPSPFPPRDRKPDKRQRQASAQCDQLKLQLSWRSAQFRRPSDSLSGASM